MAKKKSNANKVITLRCTEDGRSAYQTKKTKAVTERLELKKYSKFLRRYTLHREVKK